MIGVTYLTNVNWDTSLRDVQFADADFSLLKGLATGALKITTGAPATPANQWLPGSIVINIISGVVYRMSGSTASPAWTAITSS